MATPKDHPYKVEQRDLKQRLKIATHSKWMKLSRDYYAKHPGAVKCIVHVKGSFTE